MDKWKFHLYEKKWTCILIMLCKAIISAFLTYYVAEMLAVLVDGTTMHGIALTFRENMGKIGFLLAAIVLHYGLGYWKNVLFEWERAFSRNRVMEKILETPYDYINQKNQAEYFNIISSDLELALSFLDELDSAVTQFAKSMGAIVFIFSVSRKIGFALTMLGLAIVLYHYFISPRFGRIQDNIQTDDSHVRSIIMQEYASYKYRRFFGFPSPEHSFCDIYAKYIKSCLDKAKWQAVTSVFDYLLGFFQTYLPLLLAGMMAGEFSLGIVLAIVNNTVAFMGIFRSVGKILIRIQESLAGIKRIAALIGIRENAAVKGQLQTKISLQKERPGIEIEKLKYAYNDERMGVSIERASWDTSANIGIVGEKGCGKTTLLKVLVGLLENYQGSMTLGGQEIRDTAVSKSGYIAYLPQDFPIFDMTILENFELMAPGKSREEYMRYAALVNMDREINQMPERLNTPVNSNKVSTGQRQRLSLCMALMRKSGLLVLDEPVSNLDSENITVLRQLFGDMKEKTFLIVSHNTEIFDDSFKIYPMRKNK